MSFMLIAALVTLFVIVLALLGFKIVPQSETMIVERLGKYNRTLKTGVNIIWPILEKIKSVKGIDKQSLRPATCSLNLSLRLTRCSIQLVSLYARSCILSPI